MRKKNEIKRSHSGFSRFITYRKELSPFSKKLEAAKLIEQAATVDVDSAYRKVSGKINKKNSSTVFFSTLTRLAAILTLPLLAFTIWSLFFQPGHSAKQVSTGEMTRQTIQCPVGMRSHMVLPDGSHLWLNAGSEVTYGTPFVTENRRIELRGEAYLDVTPNESAPFIVETNHASVEVLGTQFNVNAYPGAENTEVVLKEGKVKFRFTGKDRGIKYYDLKPNDYLKFGHTGQTLQVRNQNIEKYIAWHKNILVLDDTPMEEVARLLERWYGVKVILGSDEIKKYKFTTTFNNEPLFRVLELLELSSPLLSIQYTPGKLDEDSKTASQSIVTITQKNMPM
jgi:transmembrane sensor